MIKFGRVCYEVDKIHVPGRKDQNNLQTLDNKQSLEVTQTEANLEQMQQNFIPEQPWDEKNNRNIDENDKHLAKHQKSDSII